jgi:hypothetical protein
MNPETSNWFVAWVIIGLWLGGWLVLQLKKAHRLWSGAGLIQSDAGVLKFWSFVFFDRARGFEQLQGRVRYGYLVMIGHMFLGYYAFFRHTS